MSQLSETVTDELQRIREEYARRTRPDAFGERYSYFNEAALLQMQGLERETLRTLRRRGLTNLGEKRILDIGCGSGALLQRFIAYGALAEHLAGIDLLEERVAQARRQNPAIDWRLGSAHELPYPDSSFDLVTFYTIFSSILDSDLRALIASESLRVLKPGGLILCFDFAYANPRNPAVTAIPQREIRRLFARPETRISSRRLTLAPPLARRIAPRSPWLADALEHIKLFDTHLLVSISRGK